MTKVTWPVVSQVPICLPSGEQIDLPAEQKGSTEPLPLAPLPEPATVGATGAALAIGAAGADAGIDAAAGAEASGDTIGETTGAIAVGAEAGGDATGVAPALGLLPALSGAAGPAALDSSDPLGGDDEDLTPQAAPPTGSAVGNPVIFSTDGPGSG